MIPSTISNCQNLFKKLIMFNILVIRGNVVNITIKSQSYQIFLCRTDYTYTTRRQWNSAFISKSPNLLLFYFYFKSSNHTQILAQDSNGPMKRRYLRVASQVSSDAFGQSSIGSLKPVFSSQVLINLMRLENTNLYQYKTNPAGNFNEPDQARFLVL